jgi:hypothetical protein
MTVGYVSSSAANTASGQYFTIHPAGSQEVVVHNIYCGASAIIYFGSSTATTACAPIYSLSTSGWVTGIFSHVTNINYIMVKNLSSASAVYGYDGIITRD